MILQEETLGPSNKCLGRLVGTAFDGNWEAMSGDIAFEKDIQRTISVDIRYILFIIDKFKVQPI